MLASNLSTETQSFENYNFYQPHNMDTEDLKITSQDFLPPEEILDDCGLYQEIQTTIYNEELESSNNSQNTIYTGVEDFMLGAGNDWCDGGISQSKYVTSSSTQTNTNTMKRKMMTNTTTLPVKRNKLDLTVRIQSTIAPESTSTNTVGQTHQQHSLNTASICDDILDMQAPVFPNNVSYFFGFLYNFY